VQIIIGQAQLEEAAHLSTEAQLRGILRNARAFTDGRWLFIPVESEQDCRDVEHLLRVRANPLKKTKSVMQPRGGHACDASQTEVVDSWRRLRLPAHF